MILITSDNEQIAVDRDIAERSAIIRASLEGKSHLIHPVPQHWARLNAIL